IPEAAGALATAGLASRTNTLFSIPMLFFMGASSHYPHSFSLLAFLVAVIVIVALQYNGAYPAIKHLDIVKKCLTIKVLDKQLPEGGVLAPYASIKGVIQCGAGLTVVLFLILDIL
ncbi:MAG: antitermination protein NusG, partial [Gammaproteobacteria bacterium]